MTIWVGIILASVQMIEQEFFTEAAVLGADEKGNYIGHSVGAVTET